MRTLLLWFFLVTGALAAGDWQTLDCKLLTNRYNDGDSFHCDCAGKEYIFRLYFVDAAETQADARMEDRVQQQAAYWGITEQQTLAIGQSAAKIVEQELRDKKLRVVTRLAGAGGRSKLPRYYAFVEVAGKDLAEFLIADGLARIHGVKADKPGGRKIAAQTAELQKLEAAAKAKRRGAWKVGPE